MRQKFPSRLLPAAALLLFVAAGPARALEIDLTGLDMLVSHTAATGGTVLSWHGASEIANGIGSNDEFLALAQTGPGGSEQGYNTDATIQFSTTQNALALRLADIPRVKIDGVIYYEIGLGLNETGSDTRVSLDELQIFQSNVSTLDSYDDTGPTLDGVSPIFDWFGNNDASSYAVLSDDVSGQSNVDYLFFVNASAFDEMVEYVYLYAEMGFTGSCLAGAADCDASGGEDRWVADLTTTPSGFCDGVEGIDCEPFPPAPEPGVSLLLATGLLGLAVAGRRRRARV